MRSTDYVLNSNPKLPALGVVITFCGLISSMAFTEGLVVPLPKYLSMV
jgi:hypothetical protein